MALRFPVETHTGSRKLYLRESFAARSRSRCLISVLSAAADNKRPHRSTVGPTTTRDVEYHRNVACAYKETQGGAAPARKGPSSTNQRRFCCASGVSVSFSTKSVTESEFGHFSRIRITSQNSQLSEILVSGRRDAVQVIADPSRKTPTRKRAHSLTPTPTFSPTTVSPLLRARRSISSESPFGLYPEPPSPGLHSIASDHDH